MVRLATITRICLTGPESTGKTTVANALAQEFGTSVIPEFAREYAVTRQNRLTAEDVAEIARGHIERCGAGGADGAVLFLDTDLISTVVYARFYYGACPQWIEEEARARRADLYLLMDTDVPWHPDPARDAPGEAREDLFDAFRAALDEFGCEWTTVSGDGDERLAWAREEVTRRLRRR